MKYGVQMNRSAQENITSVLYDAAYNFRDTSLRSHTEWDLTYTNGVFRGVVKVIIHLFDGEEINELNEVIKKAFSDAEEDFDEDVKARKSDRMKK